MKKQAFNLAFILICSVMFITSCTKEEAPGPETTTPDTPAPTRKEGLNSANTKEYIIADVTELSGMSKINMQDADGAMFAKYYNKCPISQPFTLLEVKK